MVIETAVGSYALGKAGEALLSKFGSSVIERWTSYRAKKFLDGFLESLNSTGEDVSDILDDAFSSEFKTEILFEAYRAVSLSRGKTIGPRSIGILTAEMIWEEREFGVYDQQCFEFLESSFDDELLEASSTLKKWFAKARDDQETDYNLKYSELQIKWYTDSNVLGEPAEISPMNFSECLGSWARRLESPGILRTASKQTIYDYEPSRYEVEGGTAREITNWIYVDTPFEDLARLIDQATPKCMTEQ